MSIASGLYGQARKITLQEALEIGVNNSVQTLNRNIKLLQGQNQYHRFKTYLLPKINLQATPISYNQVFIERYDSERNIDIYRSQKSLNSSGNLSIRQNLGLTGGQFFINTELRYLKNFGVNTYNQFTSVPFRIGYSQKLFSFNTYKWDKKIEPIRYKRIKKEYLCQIEESNEVVAGYFFDLAYAQKMYQLAAQNLKNINDLYKIALSKMDIGAISEKDLLELKLEKLNYKRNYDNAALNLRRSREIFSNFLRIEHDSIKVILPQKPISFQFSEKQAINKAIVNNPIKEELKENLLEVKRKLDMRKKSNHFSADISASIGFNQVATTFHEVYEKPKRQDIARLSVSVPILDWGINKRKTKVALENVNMTKVTNQQRMESFINEVKMCVGRLNMYQKHLQDTKEAILIADKTYRITEEMFIVGKTDVNNLNISVSKQIETQSTYIQILKQYWKTYYKLRKLTLFDFLTNQEIGM